MLKNKIKEIKKESKEKIKQIKIERKEKIDLIKKDILAQKKPEKAEKPAGGLLPFLEINPSGRKKKNHPQTEKAGLPQDKMQRLDTVALTAGNGEDSEKAQ